MKTEDLALVQGWADTRRTLVRWKAAPWRTLRPWMLHACGVAVALLFAVALVGSAATPDPGRAFFPGVSRPAELHDFGFVLARNGLVLTLHALACVAGFLAGSSLPAAAEGYSGLWRRIHEKAGPLAIGFVVCATLFSLFTQAYALGHGAADLSFALGLEPSVLLLALVPHALPELVALFLPLAAWTLASRRGAWEELLAATFVTVAVAVPVLVATAVVETWVTPSLLAILSEAI